MAAALLTYVLVCPGPDATFLLLGSFFSTVCLCLTAQLASIHFQLSLLMPLCVCRSETGKALVVAAVATAPQFILLQWLLRLCQCGQLVCDFLFFLWAFPPSLCWHHHKRMRSGPIVAVIGPPMGDPGTYYNIAICSMIECRNTDVGSKSRETGRSGDHIVHHQATEPTERTGRYKRDGVCESASTCILHSSMVKKFPHSHARVLIASEIQLINRNATHT